MENTEAGLKGLCVREIVTKIITLLINKILHYCTHCESVCRYVFNLHIIYCSKRWNCFI